MFTCESYLLRPNIIVTLDNLSEDIFVNVKNLEEVSAIKKDIDLFYIEGAISLKYFDEEIFGLKDWDLIDQLWAYLIGMIETVIEKGQSSIYFPDQPIRLEMGHIADNQILFSIKANETHRWNLPEKEFFSILLKSAYEFFNFMVNEFPETTERSKNELIKIGGLMKIIQ